MVVAANQYTAGVHETDEDGVIIAVRSSETVVGGSRDRNERTSRRYGASERTLPRRWLAAGWSGMSEQGARPLAASRCE